MLAKEGDEVREGEGEKTGLADLKNAQNGKETSKGININAGNQMRLGSRKRGQS